MELNSQRTMKSLFLQAKRQMQKVFHIHHIRIYEYHKEKREIAFFDDNTEEKLVYKSNIGLIGRATSLETLILVPDTQNHPYYNRNKNN